MTLPVRWKVTLASLVVLACGLVIAGLLAAQSLKQQEIAQSSQELEVRTQLLAHQLRPLLGSKPLPPTPDLQTLVRDLSSLTLVRVTLVAADGSVLADSAVPDRELAAV